MPKSPAWSGREGEWIRPYVADKRGEHNLSVEQERIGKIEGLIRQRRVFFERSPLATTYRVTLFIEAALALFIGGLAQPSWSMLGFQAQLSNDPDDLTCGRRWY
jgi:hypothetical protein